MYQGKKRVYNGEMQRGGRTNRDRRRIVNLASLGIVPFLQSSHRYDHINAKDDNKEFLLTWFLGRVIDSVNWVLMKIQMESEPFTQRARGCHQVQERYPKKTDKDQNRLTVKKAAQKVCGGELDHSIPGDLTRHLFFGIRHGLFPTLS